MTSLHDYQSVVQLGAALNLGFGAVEAIADQATLILATTRDRILRIARQRGGVSKLTDRQIVALDWSNRMIAEPGRIAKSIKMFSPYVFIVSGLACLILLVLSSQQACCRPLFLYEHVSILALSYGWFAIVIGERSIARLQLELKTRALNGGDKDV